MCTLKAFTLALAILCSIELEYGNARITGSRGFQTFKEGFLNIGEKSFVDGHFALAICHTNTTSLIDCDVVRRYYPNDSKSKSCKVTLKGDHDESELSISLAVAPLGKDKAILIWGDDYNDTSIVKIGTVDLKTCEMKEVKMDDPKREIFMELYYTDKMVMHDDDSFDVFINKPTKYRGKLGKMEINSDGTAKGQPTASNIEAGLIYYLAPIASRSSTKGYAYLKKNETDFILLLMKPDGSEKQLAIYANSARPAVSAGDNFVSACSQVDADNGVTCTQYDEDGTVKFIAAVSDKIKDTRPKAVRNLPDGGMLVMLAEPKSCDQPSNCKNDSKHRMMKIAADGKILGTVSAGEFDKVSSKYKNSYVYKSADSDYCGVVVGNTPTNDEQKASDFQILHHCVTEDEFAVDKLAGV